jgi:hypothetical protein
VSWGGEQAGVGLPVARAQRRTKQGARGVRAAAAGGRGGGSRAGPGNLGCDDAADGVGPHSIPRAGGRGSWDEEASDLRRGGAGWAGWGGACLGGDDGVGGRRARRWDRGHSETK